MATKLALTTGWIGSIYGVIMTLYISSGLRYLDETIRVAGVGVGLYALAFYLVTIRKPVALTALLLVLVTLNVLSLASVSLLLIPATVILILSTMLFWISTGRYLAAASVPVVLLLAAALTVAFIEQQSAG